MSARHSKIRRGRQTGPHHRHLARRDFREDRPVDVQVRSHQFVGRERQPLRERDVFEFGALEHLEKGIEDGGDVFDDLGAATLFLSL